MNWLRNKLRKWLGIDDLADNVGGIAGDIYDRDAMINGFAVPKIVYRETIRWAGKDKPIT